MFGPKFGKLLQARVKFISLAPPHRLKLRRDGRDFEALQLLWETWSEMCDFVNVGVDIDRQPIGVYVDANGVVTTSYGRIGLQMPIVNLGSMLAVETDWIVKALNGVMFPVSDAKLRHLFEVVDG